MNYYERWIGDYARDTTMLSMMDEGAYSRLMDYSYSSEKALPLDQNEIFAIGRAGSRFEKKSILRVLSLFFQRTPDGYIQKRIVEEIERYRIKQDKARKAADARWKTSRNDADASDYTCERNARASIEHGSSNAPQPHAVNLKPKTLKPPSSISSPGRTRARARIRAQEDGSAVETRDERAVVDVSSSNPLALREIVQAHGLKLTAKVENGIDAAAREGVTLATLEHALQDAQARADVSAPALYAIKSARQWTAQHPDECPLSTTMNGHGPTLTPAQQYGAKLAHTARTLTTVTHGDDAGTIDADVVEMRHVADKRHP